MYDQTLTARPGILDRLSARAAERGAKATASRPTLDLGKTNRTFLNPIMSRGGDPVFMSYGPGMVTVLPRGK